MHKKLFRTIGSSNRGKRVGHEDMNFKITLRKESRKELVWRKDSLNVERSIGGQQWRGDSGKEEF